MIAAARTVGKALKKGDIVVFESTVYPGVTEDDCVPVLEKHSGLQLRGRFHRRLFSGAHQPRRQGAHLHQDQEGGLRAGRRRRWRSSPQVYESVVTAGVHRASSIKVAEAAKVIENTQRDLNIALMNELSLIFHAMGIDTHGGARGGGHEMEFPEVPSRPGRRPLHRRRSLLPDPQGRALRLHPAGHLERAPHQRRHGQIHRAADGQADVAGGQRHPQLHGDRARADLQRELPRHPQLQGRGHHPRAARVRSELPDA